MLWSLKLWLTASGRGSLHWRHARYRTELLRCIALFDKPANFKELGSEKCLSDALRYLCTFGSAILIIHTVLCCQNKRTKYTQRKCRFHISSTFRSINPLHVEVSGQLCNNVHSLALSLVKCNWHFLTSKMRSLQLTEKKGWALAAAVVWVRRKDKRQQYLANTGAKLWDLMYLWFVTWNKFTKKIHAKSTYFQHGAKMVKTGIKVKEKIRDMHNHRVPRSRPANSRPWDLNSEKIWMVVNGERQNIF